MHWRSNLLLLCAREPTQGNRTEQPKSFRNQQQSNQKPQAFRDQCDNVCASTREFATPSDRPLHVSSNEDAAEQSHECFVVVAEWSADSNETHCDEP
jgi:hypothetical protein